MFIKYEICNAVWVALLSRSTTGQQINILLQIINHFVRTVHFFYFFSCLKVHQKPFLSSSILCFGFPNSWLSELPSVPN